MRCGRTLANKIKKDYPETEENGQFLRSIMIDRDTRLRVARGIAKTETVASQICSGRSSTSVVTRIDHHQWFLKSGAAFEKRRSQPTGKYHLNRVLDVHLLPSTPAMIGSIDRLSSKEKTVVSSVLNCVSAMAMIKKPLSSWAKAPVTLSVFISQVAISTSVRPEKRWLSPKLLPCTRQRLPWKMSIVTLSGHTNPRGLKSITLTDAGNPVLLLWFQICLIIFGVLITISACTCLWV